VGLIDHVEVQAPLRIGTHFGDGSGHSNGEARRLGRFSGETTLG